MLLDVGRKANLVGFDQKEIFVAGDKYVPVPVDEYAAPSLKFIEDELIREVLNHAAKDPTSLAAMVQYFWNSLLTKDSKKVLASSSDPTEPIRAIVLAVSAEKANYKLDDEKSRIEQEERAKEWAKGAPERERREREQERVRIEEHNKFLATLQAYADEHGGCVRVRMFANHFLRNLKPEAAASLVKMGAAEYWL